MTDRDDINQTIAVGDPVDDAPITNAHTPQVGRPFQLYNSAWARIRYQGLDLFENAPGDGWIKIL